MKKIKWLGIFVLGLLVVLWGGSVVAKISTKIPSETNSFVDDYYIEETNQNEPFFDVVLPEIKRNIKENNKHSINPYFNKLPKANNPENFQGLGSTSYANINGKTVTAEAFYRVKGDSLDDPNVGQGLLIYQCIQYKMAHPDADVEIAFTTYRASATASVCVLPQSKYYGYMRSLFGANYDEHGFVRISYMLAEAARMGIDVTIVTQYPSYAVKQYNAETGKTEKRKAMKFETYFEKALKTDCYKKYASGKKVSDFMNFVNVDWTVGDQGSNMQHVKACAVSHYRDTDGKDHKWGTFFTTSNLDDNKYNGENGNGKSQSGVIISNHEQVFRVTKNYIKLMSKYGDKEGLQELRKLVSDRNAEQTALIKAGKESSIPKSEQIIYLGTSKDPVFRVYFTPINSNIDGWDVENNPICEHVDKLAKSNDYVEFAWNEAFIEKNYMVETIGEILNNKYCEYPNHKNKISTHVSEVDLTPIANLAKGSEIGFRNLNDSADQHAKDFLMSYEHLGERHDVSILTSCNYVMVAFHYRTNSIVVIDETAKTGGDFYEIMASKFAPGMVK